MKKNKVILLTALLAASLCGCAKEEKPSTENTIIQETVTESARSEKLEDKVNFMIRIKMQ